jgi:hypothetical protein
MILTAAQIAALATHESDNRANALGDGGLAFGLYQMHNSFRQDWYGTQDLIVLAAADQRALDRFAEQFYVQFAAEWDDEASGGLEAPDESLELMLLCYNQGVAGAVRWLLEDTGRKAADHPYVKKYLAVLGTK